MTHYPPIQRRDLGICQRQLRIVASRGCLKDSHENILFGMWVEAPRVAGRRPQSLKSRTEMFSEITGAPYRLLKWYRRRGHFFCAQRFCRFACVKPKLRGIAATLSPSTYTIH